MKYCREQKKRKMLISLRDKKTVHTYKILKNNKSQIINKRHKFLYNERISRVKMMKKTLNNQKDQNLIR